MNDKVSKYNSETEHSDCILLYNALTDRLLPASYKNYAVIETLMDNLQVFQDKYPDLYLDFKNSGFIIPSDYDELAYIKLQNRRRVFTNKDYHITINPTLDCNLKCWYCPQPVLTDMQTLITCIKVRLGRWDLFLIPPFVF